MEKRYGHGIYEWKEGHSYEGYWVEGTRHGHGTQKWQDGSSYKGEWEHDKRHGHGTQKWQDGSSYEGEWFDGKRHGKGIYTKESGCILDCTWENDFEMYGIATWPDGRTFKGQWINRNVGIGIWTDPDGDVFHIDSEAGVYVWKGETLYIPNISIYHTFDEPVPGLGAYDGPIWKRIQIERGLDNLYDLMSHFFDLNQEPDKLVRFFEQVVSHDIAVSCTDFIVERWGKQTIPEGMNRYDYLKEFTKYKPSPLVHDRFVTFDNGTSCSYKTRLLSRLPNTLSCFDEHQHKIEWTCSICMSDIPETDKIKRTWLMCGHSFHNSCIFEWFHKKKTCPMCRMDSSHLSFIPNSVL